MNKLTKTLALAIGAALISTTAFAGSTNPQPVQIDLDNMIGTGDMVTARGDKDDEVFIGCGTRNLSDGMGGLFSWAFCQGTDSEGDSATCFTFDPELVKTVREINDGSWITFSWTDDGSGTLTCNRMGFSTQSFYLGKDSKANKVPKD